VEVQVKIRTETEVIGLKDMAALLAAL